MPLQKTREFEKDVKRLDKPQRKRLGECIDDLQAHPGIGKPMEHFHNVVSIRLSEKRLVYYLKLGDSAILLLLYKNRDEVYEYLKRMELE